MDQLGLQYALPMRLLIELALVHLRQRVLRDFSLTLQFRAGSLSTQIQRSLPEGMTLAVGDPWIRVPWQMVHRVIRMVCTRESSMLILATDSLDQTPYGLIQLALLTLGYRVTLGPWDRNAWHTAMLDVLERSCRRMILGRDPGVDLRNSVEAWIAGQSGCSTKSSWPLRLWMDGPMGGLLLVNQGSVRQVLTLEGETNPNGWGRSLVDQLRVQARTWGQPIVLGVPVRTGSLENAYDLAGLAPELTRTFGNDVLLALVDGERCWLQEVGGVGSDA